MTKLPTLKRHLTTTTLTFYGVGVIIGAGIYVLIGKIAGITGNAVWLSFLISAIAAFPTGLSYAELASRYPKSAGEAVFADRAFRRGTFSFLVGFLILASGVASVAALSHGFAGYFGEFVSLPRWMIIVVFLSALTALNYWGIREATWVNVFCTVVSVGALIVLICFGIQHWGNADLLNVSPIEKDGSPIALLLTGAALAFYAYIGFEDICNVAEEVKEPEKTIPKAILLSIGITMLVYLGVALTVVSVASPKELVTTEVPLVIVAEKLIPFLSTKWLSVVALFAVINSALFNLIMASRILYGMGRNSWIPLTFGRVSPWRQTPTLGVITAGILALLFALTGFLKVLAESTNIIILTAFFCVNLSLLVIRFRKVPPDDPKIKHFHVPLIVPIIGMLITAYMVAQFSSGAYLRAALLVIIGVLLYGIHRRSA